ncbi:allantoate amidohydrolase [Novacetimonas maltaceti]|uniref:Hydantoin utilization protein C n=1 Tax=Novacetimonas maltaceti TaxID=1203393 RepID=A0A2S3VZT4_9PROT|nr:allantoate amidohydrolase [Novacetimonas maltaceti]POF62116.1 Hydantoin utilization protein C [Novacetimonas maltaceti]PYD59157.1 allantoate amidohydrolase [Novacetimonas maltaceti]
MHGGNDACGARAVARCTELGRAPYSQMEGGLFRPYLGPSYRATCERLAQWMQDAGMATRMDAAGNLIGRYGGQSPDAPVVLIGSHIDSVRDGGFFDGMLGVVLGIEAVAHFARQGKRFPFALEVIGFGDEEGSRFPRGMLTSHAVAGVLESPDPDMTDCMGTATLATALREYGLDAKRMHMASRRDDPVVAYVEAHIEQGPVLEAEGHALGVVSAIAAQHRYRVTLCGMAGHAGTVAMKLRRDALAGAAEIILAVERVGRAGGDGLVATVGSLEVAPGAANVVPGHVAFTIDVRAGTNATRDDAAREILHIAHQVAKRRGLGMDVVLQQDLDATPCGPRLTDLMKHAVRAVTHTPARLLVSGAGHDAMVMAHLAPVSMLFIRCAGGISHNPAESVTDADAGLALRAMTTFIGLFERRFG